MEFPVDILASVAPESLEQSAKDYMSKLLYRNSEIQEYLSIPGSKKIEIGLCNVSFVPLYGVDIKQKLLALFSPEDPFKAVGLYLLDRWWSAEDILKTADSSRTGLIKVRTTGERIVLYVLNRIIYRTKEMAGNDAPFLCHGEDEIAKILWKNGEAIGFYSVKPEGRLCKRFLTHHYQLPVMDTIFIRKCHRGNGHGLQMLEDFVDRFKKDLMGLKYPLSPAMYKVCKKYLSRYPEDTELLWEIEGVGSPFQRTQIARKLQAMDLKGNHQALGKSNLETEDIPMEAGFRQVQETMEHIEVVEEVVRIKITKEVQDTPVTTRGRSSNLKRKKLGADKEETPGKILRVEDIEPDVQSADDPVHEYGKLSVIVKEPELKDTVETMTHDVTPISETTHLHCEDQNKLTPEPTYQSEPEKDQVDEITPVMEIQSLKDNAQIMKTFEATIVPVDLQPLELHQVVEVEIVKMSSETEEVKEKGVEVKEMKDDVNKVIPLDERETSEEIVESQKDQTEMADTTNIEDIVDEVEMRKISVENIVGDTEVEKEEPGVLEVSLVEKEQSEQVKVMHTVEETGTVQECLCDKEQETEDQELSPDNEWEKVSSLIQQEEYSNMAYSSGLKGKCGDKRRSNYETPLRHSVRLRDQAAEGELAERVLRSSSKQTLKTTSKQVYTRQARSIKQPEKIKQVEDEPKEKGFNQTESQAECTEKAQQRTDDQNPREVENKMEDSSQDENKMDEKLRNEEQDKMTAAAEEVGKAAEDGEEMGIADVNNAEAYTDGENVVVVEDKIKKKNIEETEVRHDKIEIEENILSKDEDGVSEPTVTDENKIEEAQEEELMKEPNAIQSEEPEINDIELSLDYEDGKDGEKMAVVDVHDAEDVNTAQIEVEVKVPEPSVAEPFEEQEEESTLEMMPAEIVQNTEEATSTLKLQKVAVVLVDLDTVSTTHTYASENASGKSQPERTDDRGNKEEEGLNQQVEPTEKEQEVEMAENENETVEGEISSIEETEEIMERVITTDVDRVSELTTDENKMEDFQQEKVLKETKTVQDAPDEEIKSKDIIESSEDDEEVKSDVQIELSEEEEDKTSFVTPLRRSRRLRRQAVESELTKRVLRSSTKAAKATSKTKAVMQQAKTKQPVDDPEEQVKEVLESDTETAVKEKIESVSITTETEEVKALEGKKPGQSAAEPTEEQEEEPASETGPSEDDYTEEATSPLKLQKVAVGLVDFDTVSTTHTDAGKDAKGTSQSQEEVDLELHKLESPSTGSQAEHSEKEQVVEMTENEIETGSIEETDEKMESEEGDVLNDEDRVPLSTVPDEENIEEVRNETDTAQEIAGEEPKSRHVIEPSEDDGERSDVLDEEDEASSVTPLRRSRRLEDQAAESKLTKRSLRSSAKLTNKATPQQRHERQIKAMMLQEEPEKLDESKNNEMNVILGSEVAVGDHMESDGDPENMISAVQSTCEEGSSLEKTDIEADDHKNIKNIRTSDGNEVENNIRSEGVTEQDKMAPEDIIHGETEQVCTAVHIELSEVLEEAENNVQEEGAATEMAYGEDSENIMETTTTLTLQEASVVLMDIKEVLPNLTGDCSSAFETAQEEMVNNLEIGEQAVDMPEEVKEGIQTEVVEGENIEIESVNLTEGDSTDLNAAAKGTAEEDSSVLMSHLENETTDTNKLEEENIVMKHGDESKVEEESKTEQFTLQGPILTQDSVLKECSETTTHVHGILDLHNAEVVKNNISIEEQEEELAIEELALEEDRANVVGSMSMLKLQKAAVMLVDFQRHTGGNEADGNETTQSQEVALLTKANEENALVEMDAIEPVTEGIEEEAVCMDNTLITNDEQDRDILAEEGVKDELKEVEHTTLKEKSTATELDSTKTLKEGQESTAPAHGDGVQEHTQDEDISVYTNRNLRRRTYTKVNKNREEEISDEEVETVFTRSLRRRTVTVTPRRRSKRLTGTRVAELEMDSLVTKVCPEILAVQSTEESRAAVEEAHETNSKCDTEEVPAVSEAVRKDWEQDKNIPGNDLEKVEEGNDGDSDMVEAAVDHKEILVEGDLPDEYQEKEEPELNQEQVRSASSGQERDQQDNAPEETLLEKTFEEEPSKRVEEKHLVVQSDEGVGVERRALRKRTITTKATSVRKSKRLCKQDQGENDGQTVVWTNTGDSATVMADVKSLAENETTDQGKGQEIEDTNTKGGEISHKDEDQENAEGEEIDGNATNSQESTTGTEDMSKQAQLSEFLNVSEEDTDSKLVAQEEKNGEENKEEQSATEEITESENNAGAADKVTDEPKEFEDTQGEPEQIEKNAEEMTEASVTVDGNFTLELDEEIDRKDAECHRVVEETKASFQESEKEIADAGQESGVMTKRFLRGRKSATASPEQRSSRRSRRLLQDSLSETEDKSEAEEVRKVIGEEVKKPQQKRKAVVELTARRSKRLTGAEIV